MPSKSYPPAGADAALTARPAAEDDASISWMREPADGEVDTGPMDRTGTAAATAPESAARLWSEVGAQAVRNRWREVQLRFIDDPSVAVRDAEALVIDATEELAAAIAARRDDLAGRRSGNGGDTEQLRVAVRRYRDVLDRILEL